MADLQDPDIMSVERRNRKKNVRRYLLLFFGALTYAYFFGGILPYTLLYLMISLPVISGLHLLITVQCFRLSERVSERTFVKGECASYHLVLQNACFLYMPYITVHMQMEGQFILKSLKSMRISLAPFSKREFRYDMPLLFRGRYDIGVNCIEFQDILGMFSYRMNPYEKKSILVKPRIIEIPFKDIPSARISEGDVSSGFQEVGNDEIRDIREYAYGDSFRKIHWKLTSKLSKTMVKDTRNELDNDVLMILNLKKPDLVSEAALMKEDCVIEELVSNAYYLLRRNIPVKLCLFSEAPFSMRATSISEFDSLYQVLSEVKFSEERNFNDIYDYFTDIEQSCKLVYVFTVDLDSDMISKSHHVINKGFDVELYYVNVSDIPEDDEKARNDLADVLMKSNIKGYLIQPRAVLTEGRKEEIENPIRVKARAEAYEAQI
jgi:uncharacterized protein (DUF58 family)